MNLSERIPIWKVENHLLLSKTQSLSVCIELTMPEAYSLSKDQLIEQYNTFNRLIKALPKGYLLHKQDYYTEKYYLRSGDTLGEHSTFLASAYERHFNERVYLSHKSYLFISKAPNDDQFTSNFLTSFITGRFIQKDIRDKVPEFENTVLKLMHILKSSNIPTKILKQKEVTQLLNIYFNLGDSRILQDINLHQNHLKIGDKDVLIYNSVGSEIELPKELDVDTHADAFFDRSVTFPIGIGFKYPHIVNTIIRKNDPNNLVKLLSKKREKILSMTFKSRENQQLVGVYDTFLSDVINTGETPVYVSQNIMLWGKDQQINKAENELNNALAKMDIYTQRNFNCANVFFGCCPGNAYDLPISEFQIQLSDAATLLFPIETNPKNTGINGIQISERDYGIPIIIDHWDLPMQNGQITNRNMFILGPSGSGKSFFTNFLTRQLVQQDYHITIIDVGGSYRRLCNHMGGKYFEYTANSKMQFNPFFVPKIKGEYLKKNLEEQESLKTLVFTLWKGESAVTTKEEETILARCITEYYELVQQENIKPMFDSFYEFVQNSFAPKLEAKQRRYFDMDSFAMVLRPYYKGGEYDYLLNSPEEFSIADIPFCVFELDEIKDHSVIFPVVTLVIMEAFISKMRRHKKVRKMIFIEEAWSAISNEGMANFLKYLYKTVRKFNGAVGIITQEIEDILNNPFIRNAVINNADVQILLDQTKYITRFDELARALGLPQSEMKKILSINKMSRPDERYKDVYIRFGQTGKVYSTLVSPEEAVMFSTEASESLALDRLVEIEGDHKIAVMRMLEQKQQQKQLLKAKEMKKAS